MRKIKCGDWLTNKHQAIYFVLLTISLIIPVHQLFALGVCKWTPNGVVVCNANGTQGWQLNAISDCKNGAIICWNDNRGTSALYAQRIDSLGNGLWLANGISVVTPFYGLWLSTIPDGYGGAIIAWQGGGNSYDIWTQRLDSLGNRLWSAPNGVHVCADSGVQSEVQLTTDGHGGAIIVWTSGLRWPVKVGNSGCTASGWTAQGRSGGWRTASP